MNLECFRKMFLILVIGLSIFIFISCKSVGSDLNIINGKFIDDGQYPTVVRIKGMSTYTEDCSGTIVSNNVILTAAHCVLDEENNVRNVFVEVDGKTIKGSSYIFLDTFKKNYSILVEYVQKKRNVQSLYLDKKISRSEYENEVKKILEKMRTTVIASHDLAVVIFDNIDGGSPFKSIIDKAKNEGMFLNLSKNSFENGTAFKNDGSSIFFLGFGGSGNYSQMGSTKYIDPDSINYDETRKQIGYNTFTYDKNENKWYSPRPINKKIEDYLYTGSAGFDGDSGGPLIYKNQILGVLSGDNEYDCEGNDIFYDIPSDKYFGKQEDGSFLFKIDEEGCQKDTCCGKIVYASSTYTSISLGNPIVETFLKKVKDELSRKGLLNSNSIFSELLE